VDKTCAERLKKHPVVVLVFHLVYVMYFS